jgi:hypothetical protein
MHHDKRTLTSDGTIGYHLTRDRNRGRILATLILANHRQTNDIVSTGSNHLFIPFSIVPFQVFYSRLSTTQEKKMREKRFLFGMIVAGVFSFFNRIPEILQKMPGGPKIVSTTIIN